MERRFRTKRLGCCSTRYPDISVKINRTIHAATGKSPNEVMFGHKPRWNSHLSPTERECATLENVSDEITHELPVPDQSSTSDESHTFTTSYEFDLNNAPSALLPSIQPICTTQASTSSKTANPTSAKCNLVTGSLQECLRECGV